MKETPSKLKTGFIVPTVYPYQNQIEIWASNKYEEMLDQEPEDFSAIADELFDFSTKVGDK